MSMTSRIIELQREVAARRRQELNRAIDLQDSDPIQAAYHTGLADGHNNVVRELDLILDTTSEVKGENRNGRREAVRNEVLQRAHR